MNAWDRLVWSVRWRKYPIAQRPRCLDCRTPLKDYGKLCDDCRSRPDNFLPSIIVPEKGADYGKIARVESEYSDGPDCDIKSHYFICNDCGGRTHLGFPHSCKSS